MEITSLHQTPIMQRRPGVHSHSGEKWLHLLAALSSSLVTCTHSPNSFREASHHLPSTPLRRREWRGDACYKRHRYGSVDIYWAFKGLQFIPIICLRRHIIMPIVPVCSTQRLAVGAHPVWWGEDKWATLFICILQYPSRPDFIPEVKSSFLLLYVFP